MNTLSGCVTGMHRSGTTWLGTLISKFDKMVAIHEPCNFGYGLKGVPRWYIDGRYSEDRDFVDRLLREIPAGSARFQRDFSIKRPVHGLARLVLGNRSEREWRVRGAFAWRACGGRSLSVPADTGARPPPPCSRACAGAQVRHSLGRHNRGCPLWHLHLCRRAAAHGRCRRRHRHPIGHRSHRRRRRRHHRSLRRHHRSLRRLRCHTPKVDRASAVPRVGGLIAPRP